MSFKRNDHVFNHSLKQTLVELSTLVEHVLMADWGGRYIHGAADRAARLRGILALLHQGMNQPAFDLVVDKPEKVAGGDANSVNYGEAKKQMVYAFRQFLEALRRWEIERGYAERGGALDHLKMACLGLRPVIVRWTEAAIDPEAEALCKKESPDSARTIADGRDYLARLRDDLIALIRWYTP